MSSYWLGSWNCLQLEKGLLSEYFSLVSVSWTMVWEDDDSNYRKRVLASSILVRNLFGLFFFWASSEISLCRTQLWFKVSIFRLTLSEIGVGDISSSIEVFSSDFWGLLFYLCWIFFMMLSKFLWAFILKSLGEFVESGACSSGMSISPYLYVSSALMSLS